MVTQNEHSVKFLQLTDLLHVLQVTLADIRPDKFKEKKERKKREEIKKGRKKI